TGRFLGHGVPPCTRSVRPAVPAGIASPTASGILSPGGQSKQGRVRLPVLPTLAMLPSRCGGYNEVSVNATIADATGPKGRLATPLWTEIHAAPPLPMTAAEMAARGWDAVDVVFVSGDAYVDHSSFAMAILGRVLEAAGFRVAILSQPDWRSCDPWRQF